MPTGVSFMRSRLTNVSHWVFFWRKVLAFFVPFLTIVLGVVAAQWSSPFCDIGTWLTHRCITSSQKKRIISIFQMTLDDETHSWDDHDWVGKTILQEKETIHYNITICKFIPMHQAMKIPAAKAAVDKKWKKLEKISAWNLTKVRSKKEVNDEARTKGEKVHFASLMDKCLLKNAELEAKHQKHKGRVVLRGDFVKDDSGPYAVFTEQGSSASHMTAAKVMDIISRLLACAGQAAYAVSAYTQVKMEDAPK